MGRFDLCGANWASQELSEIQVLFDSDDNGIFKVTARNELSHLSNQLIVSDDRGRLSAADVERMIDEAEKCREVEGFQTGQEDAP